MQLMHACGQADIGKHRADAATNKKKVERMRPGDDKFRSETWADVCVGDVLKIYDRETFPGTWHHCRPPRAAGRAWCKTRFLLEGARPRRRWLSTGLALA